MTKIEMLKTVMLGNVTEEQQLKIDVEYTALPLRERAELSRATFFIGMRDFLGEYITDEVVQECLDTAKAELAELSDEEVDGLFEPQEPDDCDGDCEHCNRYEGE